MGVDAYVRTTVAIREDLYQRIKRSGKGLSETVNDALARELPRPDARLVGKYKWGSRDDIRDRKDRV